MPLTAVKTTTSPLKSENKYKNNEPYVYCISKQYCFGWKTSDVKCGDTIHTDAVTEAAYSSFKLQGWLGIKEAADLARVEGQQTSINLTSCPVK